MKKTPKRKSDFLMSKTKEEIKIKKGDLVFLSYKLFDENNKLIDESHPAQPIVIELGKTKISHLLAKNLKGKIKGDVFEIKQKLKEASPNLELGFEDFEDEDLEKLEEGKQIDLTINGKNYIFKVLKINKNNSTVTLQYTNPVKDKLLTNKVKIIDVKRK